MDLKKIQSLLKIVAESGVAEIEVEEEGLKLIIRKNSATVTVQPSYYPPMQMGYNPALYPPPYAPPAPVEATAASPAVAAPTTVSANDRATDAAPSPKENKVPAENETVIRAPIVGTFYRRSAPDSDAYVEVGQSVKPGDILCIIEAMKLMNEIECEVSGTIKQILVEDANPVEYDQPLFIVSTD